LVSSTGDSLLSGRWAPACQESNRAPRGCHSRLGGRERRGRTERLPARPGGLGSTRA